MRILLVNANTSRPVTEIAAKEARRVASPGTKIVAATGTFGARVISTRAENAIGEHSTLALMARHHKGCAAAVIAVSFDTGLRAAREMLPIPVVGMTEAALLTACMVGGKCGMVIFGRRSLPAYQELVEGYGLASRVGGWMPIEAAVRDVYSRPETVETQLVDAANRLVEDHGVESVILSGTALAGMPKRIQKKVPVPVLNGVPCAVLLAESLARLGFPKSRTGSYASLPEKELVGVEPPIAKLFSGSAAPKRGRSPVRRRRPR